MGRRRSSLILSFAVLAAVFGVLPVFAATYTVTTTADAGGGSLRQAILDANTTPGADTIHFNIPGAGVHTIEPVSPLPSITESAIIDGFTQPGAASNSLAGGNNSVLLIELSGANSGAAGSGLMVNAGSVTIFGLVINRFTQYGISVTGTGILYAAGNFIGTNPAGTAAGPGNGSAGILLNTGSGGTHSVGGGYASQRNLLSGNGFGGIYVSTADLTIIQGNYIGTNAAGSSAIGNNVAGILVRYGSGHVIGAQAAGARNLISGNSGDGIYIDNGIQGFTTQGVVITGNYIGTDYSGTAAVPNAWNGISLMGRSVHVRSIMIGGDAAGSGNLISGNGMNGILLQGEELVGVAGSVMGNTIQGNTIGVNAQGAPLPNGQSGITINSVQASSLAWQNTIGGSEQAAANTIAHNTGNGVTIAGSSATQNAVLLNSIFSNGQLGIDLGGDGLTSNDAGDTDTGPEELQNFPVLISARAQCGYTNVRGTLNSAASAQYTIQFFANSSCDASGYGEGQTYLGRTIVTTDISGNASFSVILPATSPGAVVTATASDLLYNTSEFSACVSVGSGSQFAVNSTADAVDATPGDGICASSGGACTLRAAVQEANAQPFFSCISVPAGYYILAASGPDEDAAATGDLDILSNMVITGAGDEATYIFGPSNDRVIHVDPLGSGVAAAISGMAMQGTAAQGVVGAGGCIANNGTLQIDDSRILGSNATFGGGIYNQKDVFVNNSTLGSNNGVFGGGVYTKWGRFRLNGSTVWANLASTAGAGINTFDGSSLEIINSTISGNAAYPGTVPGGGINAEAGTVTITNSTISNNYALGGGAGVRNISATGSVKNTIIAVNSGGDCAGPTLTSNGHNLEFLASCGFTAGGDIQNTNPLLGPLGNNSGRTQTHALLPGSPAIDAGTSVGAPATDQRGVSRPYGTAVDIGAYEFIPPGSGLVRIAGTTPVYYPTIQFGYDATVDGDALQAQAVTFSEVILFDRPVSVSFQGGFDAGFSAPGSPTIVAGSVHISAGAVTIDNLLIR